MKEAPPDPRFDGTFRKSVQVCRCPEGTEKTCANPECPRKPQAADLTRSGLPGDVMMKSSSR